MIEKFLVGMVKNEYGQSVLWTLKLIVSQERTDGTDFWHARTISHKSKDDWKFFWWAWSKLGVASHSKMNRWNEVIFIMLVRIQESWKLIQVYLGGRGQKWPWLFSSWDPDIYCTLRIDLWIELVFWMVIVMQ